MIYKVKTASRFDREFKALDRYTMKMIKVWIERNLVNCEDPWTNGKALVKDHIGEWHYRIGDYRLICRINDGELIILALNIGQRREVL
ncbi:MAG: type II toxin-antitoxin system RelE/ParE family toxin [Oscillospiraceae bacterium]|nr:type II toxin-antitoxin system RelE/ParE family toxin [Oscillospiraceae bacterium]